jgi:MFS family permease
MKGQDTPQRPSHDDRKMRGDESKRGSTLFYFAWVAVFILNLPVPLLFAEEMTREHGRVGMAVAAVLILACGILVCCAVDRKIFGFFIFGAVIVGLAQMAPVLQFIAGLIAILFAHILRVGLIESDDSVKNELGGFIITFVTGGILIAASAIIGGAIYASLRLARPVDTNTP